MSGFLEIPRWERVLFRLRGWWHGVPPVVIYHAERVGFTVYPECDVCGREGPSPCFYCGHGSPQKGEAE
jgi:hypothetical protein